MKTPAAALRLLAVLAFGAVGVAACGPLPTPVPSPSVVHQRHVCGDEILESCDEAIAIVVANVPEIAASPVAVADVEVVGSTFRKGGGFDIIVSFAPLPGVDEWMNPPTWRVHYKIFSPYGATISPWIGMALPDRYVRLLQSAGLE